MHPSNNEPKMEDKVKNVKLRSSVPAVARVQSTYSRRRSLNISHFNAVQNAVSNLARIDDFHLEELGYGFFSDVFKVTHKQTGKVMVLKRNKNTNSKMNILREVQLMNRLRHPNILKFKGVCVHEGQLHALTEYINGGDLDQLVTKENVDLSWKQRVQIALDIARGLQYLHSKGIFHRDLTAKNCLIRESRDQEGNIVGYGAVVADLGLAEKIPTTPEESAKLSIVGTPYVIAPEVIHGKPYDQTADVFSYGILLCQLIALVSCDPEELPRAQDFGLARDLFHKMISGSKGPGSMLGSALPPPSLFLKLAYECCKIDPKSRPSFDVIIERLEFMLSSIKKKLLPKRSSSFKGDDDVKRRFSAQEQEGEKVGNERVKYERKERRVILGRENKNIKRIKARPSSCSRLSRSFSDISRELLTHAANMIIASQSNTDNKDDVTGLYSNPFSALEHLSDGNMKLTDEPSLALLEMTFDLAQHDQRKTNHNANKRPHSSFFADMALHDHITPTSPISPRSPINDVTPIPVTHCDGTEGLQRAVHRAMVLSPRGNNLTSWLCARKHDVTDNRQSIVSVMSVLSKNMRSVRRCISLPDLSRMSALFQADQRSRDRSYSDRNQFRSPDHGSGRYLSPDHGSRRYRSPDRGSGGYRSPDHGSRKYRSPDRGSGGYRSPDRGSGRYRSPLRSRARTHDGDVFDESSILEENEEEIARIDPPSDLVLSSGELTQRRRRGDVDNQQNNNSSVVLDRDSGFAESYHPTFQPSWGATPEENTPLINPLRGLGGCGVDWNSNENTKFNYDVIKL